MEFKKFIRDDSKRIFVNRSLNLDKIHYYGFDMDYTLAVYKHEFELMQYKLTIERLISQRGYPKSLQGLTYDRNFGLRGLYIDKFLGNILKVDEHGYILVCYHGRQPLPNIDHVYPQKFVLFPEDINNRYICVDTLFGLPEICLYADIVTLLDKTSGINVLSYSSIFEDVRSVFDGLHHDGTLKNMVIEDIGTYIEKNSDLSVLFYRLRKAGKKIFLLTNSEYSYTSKVMSYLLEPSQKQLEENAPEIVDYSCWKDYFDIIITSASKPRFFDEEGTTLREVDEATNTLKILNLHEFKKGTVYTGGSINIFRKFTKTVGSEVLYIGDNISHDVIFTKTAGYHWRTCLVVKELEMEIRFFQNSKDERKKLLQLEYLRAKMFSNLDSSSSKDDIISEEMDGDWKNIHQKIKHAETRYDAKFNPAFGSLFHHGGHIDTKFSVQISSYADLYCSDYIHFLYYPFFYYFLHLPKNFPHEHE